MAMTLTSPAFADTQSISSRFTCDSENINPPLLISDAPTNARSMALIVDDPDAAKEGGWVHWLVWNISPEARDISEGAVPIGAVEGTTDFGGAGYGGPCPPSGTHHYHFRLFALDMMLELPITTDRVKLEKAMEGHIIERSELIGTYQRI